MTITKTLDRIEVKNADRGEVSAVFSTFGVVDKDGDITQPGAFENGAEVVISSYGHSSWQGALPVGKGTVRTTGQEAILDGKFFMDTAAGKDTFRVVKELGERQEWSYGFDIEESSEETHDGQDVRIIKKVNVFEVSPVLLGAGVNTRTIAAKAATDTAAGHVLYKAAIRPHTTSDTARPWDGPAVKSAIPDDATVDQLRSMHAWVDTSADPTRKESYRLAHHHHGVDGPVNIRACVASIAELNSGKSGIPDADRQGVYNHLAGHLRDADREPPELRTGGQQKNIDRINALLAELAEVVDSIREVGSSRATRGKSLSSLTYEVLGWAEEDMLRVLTDVRVIKQGPREAAATEAVRYLAQEFKRN